MELTEIGTIIGSTLAIGAFFWKIIDKRFDKIDAKFDRVWEEFKNARNQTEEKLEKMWNKVDERFEMARNEMQDHFREVRNAMQDLRERLSILEAETIMYNIIPDENKRSEAAKKMWDRRRSKKILKISKKD